MNLTSEERIRKARILLERESPFFSYLAMSLKLRKFTEEEKDMLKEFKGSKATMGVDGEGNLYYDDDFVNSLDIKTLAVVLKHETLHCGLCHTIRGRNRKNQSPLIWNIAIDLKVNGLLKEDGANFGNLEERSVIPNKNDEFDYGKIKVKDCSKKTAEELYDEIYKQAKENNMLKQINQYSQSKGFDNHLKDDKGMSQKKKEPLENKWKKRMTEAHTRSKMAGKEVSGIDRIIEDLLTPKISWKELLYKYITSQIISDYSWKKRSRRSIPLGIYLPSTLKENLDLIAVVDLSGSIDDSDLKDFLSEMVGIANSFESVNLKIITHEYGVGEVFDLKNVDEQSILNLKLKGGGGTAFSPVIDYLNEEEEGNKVVVWLTDGYGDRVKKQDFPLIWVLAKDGSDELIKDSGEVIKLE